ncbi:MAG: uroporphyrinogen decarboxylase [Planctomycetota bacterium]
MSRPAFRAAGNASGMSQALWASPFMQACRGERPSRTPVWLMRQAGRYMAEYRQTRADRDFLDLCLYPELACEVTVTAQQRIDADAAIIFADILLVNRALGQDLRFATGHGPVLEPVIRAAGDVDSLRDPDQAAADCGFLPEAIRQTRAALPKDIPLIGFSGAPFTLAAYAIEGGGSRQFAQTRLFMYHQEAAWHRLMQRLVDTLIPYLSAQVAAGAQALQVFDSWVGQLTLPDYQRFVHPHTERLLAALPAGVPVILFGTGTRHLLPALLATGPDVLGMDHHTPLLRCWQDLGGAARVSVQGNLDPALLLAPRALLLERVDAMLAELAGQAGWIANLGHGVLKETPVDNVIAAIERIHAAS